MIDFFKYQGTGNDFIMIDNRSKSFDENPDSIAYLCHRRFGIGADGLILLENPTDPDCDFKMVYYNSDGRESTMCGNGGRCIVRFAADLGLVNGQTVFTAIDGKHQAVLLNDSIALKMMDVFSFKTLDDAYIIDSGSPHYICFVEDISKINVEEAGKAIRYSEKFKTKGVNVNFVETGKEIQQIRTYERGVEAETYSCGTGVTASALALNLSGKIDENIIYFKTLGGQLNVRFKKIDQHFEDIWLTGPATRSFLGQFNLTH